MAEAHVLKLIINGNKPISLQNVIDLSQTQGFKKAQCQKAVDTLSESGKITTKEFGKTKIYLAPQAGLSVLSKEEIDSKKAETKELAATLINVGSAVRTLETELAEMKSAMTEAELDGKILEMQTKASQLESKLKGLRSGAVLISPEARSAAERALTANLDHWRRRKSMFKNIWNTVSEGIEGKSSDLFEEMGVDTDEAVGVGLEYTRLELLLPSKRYKKM